MSTAARRIPTLIRVGRQWRTEDGRYLPLVMGGDDTADDPAGAPTLPPDDLTGLSDDELQAHEDSVVAEFDRLYDEGTTDVQTMEELAQALERVRGEQARREQEAADAEAARERLRAQVHAGDPEDPDPDDGDPQPDPEGTPDPEGSGEREPALVAGARPTPPVRRGPSASATAQRAPRPAAPARRPVTITAAADLPGLTAGANVNMRQVAVAMHDRARSLSDHSARMPVASFHVDYPTGQFLPARASADAVTAAIEMAMQNAQGQAIGDAASLVAAGGWCTPSQNLYDLVSYDGATGLINLPSVGIERGGINFPSYISIEAADGALWTWTEGQDLDVTDTITDLDVVSGVGTMTVSDTHLLAIGDVVELRNMSNPAMNGVWPVATVPTTTTATLTMTGVADSANATGSFQRQKGCFTIPCPTWSEERLIAYGLCLKHGNLADRSFPELTQRFVQLAMNAHLHRMSAIHIAKIRSATHSDAVTVTATGSDSYGELMSALELQAVDFRSEHNFSGNVALEVLLPSWAREDLRTSLAMRRTDSSARAVTNEQIDAELAVRNVRAQFLEDYQSFYTGARATAWPTTMEFVMYPAGDFIEGNGGRIDLGVVRDSRLNATNDFTAAWTEDFRLLARRGPKARRVTVTLGAMDGKTGGDGA